MNQVVHRVPANTMTQAFTAALGSTTAFDFDLLDQVKNVTSKEFAQRLLGRWAFACDAYINNAIHSTLRDFRIEREASGNADWDNYQDFLAFVAGIAPQEQAMTDMGLDTTSLTEQVQRLYAMRCAIHSTIASIVSAGTTYDEPDIIEFFLDPKPRKDDAITTAKREANSREYATDDDGVINVEKMQQHEKLSILKSKHNKAQQLEFDRQRGVLSAELFRTLIGSGQGPDVDDPFGDLDGAWKFKMLNGMLKYIEGVLEQASDDFRISVSEHTNWHIEARPLRKAIKLALAHPAMTDAERELAKRTQ